MTRIVLLFALSLAVGACGSSESSASAPTQTETIDTSGADTTNEPSEPATASEPTIVDGTDVCQSDADCVPGGCCHPTTCVSVEHPPVCGESVCTTDCRYGTLDCGGGCLCHEGHCAARLSQAPNIPGVTDVQ